MAHGGNQVFYKCNSATVEEKPVPGSNVQLSPMPDNLINIAIPGTTIDLADKQIKDLFSSITTLQVGNASGDSPSAAHLGKF